MMTDGIYVVTYVKFYVMSYDLYHLCDNQTSTLKTARNIFYASSSFAWLHLMPQEWISLTPDNSTMALF